MEGVDDLKAIIRRQQDLLMKLKRGNEILEAENKKLKEEKREWLIEKEEMKEVVGMKDELKQSQAELEIVAEQLSTCQKLNIQLRRENDSLKNSSDEIEAIKKENEVMKKKNKEYETKIITLVKIVEQCKKQVNDQTDRMMKMKLEVDEEHVKMDKFNSTLLSECKKNDIELDPLQIASLLHSQREEVNKMKIMVDDYKFRYNRAIERLANVNNGDMSSQSDTNSYITSSNDVQDFIE